ncbi:helveticin J family class III bacteriocin [Lactiplantibacillus dongliensis]|uniref:Helveticin J family class III bacteriocin n=1 Tax=Lactiplantibacillus dongliensis TaxID=2559919 RepID=A0ABW1R7U8_9LACO|nr:helveticin J family class III bacteriocin [Lactiplantibacillus dongliensis]
MKDNGNKEQIDEPFDSGRPVLSGKLILDRDDFLTDDSMDEYFKNHPEAPRQAYEYYLRLKQEDTADTEDVGTRQVVKASTATGTLVYTLSGLPTSNVVQNCYIGSSYLYTVQQVNNRSGATGYISRFKLNNTSSLKAQDHMTLLRFGHGQTLQWFDNSVGTAYFWVICKAMKVDYPDYPGDTDWGTQVGRIRYVAGSTIDYTGIARISSINRANKTGASFGSLKRCEAALDSSRNYLLIWSMNSSNNVQFSYYKASTINKVLDDYEGKVSKYISAENVLIRSACVQSYAVSSFYSKVYNESVQGIEFNNAQAIYISSGKKFSAPVIQKGGWGTENFKSRLVTIVGGYLSSPGQSANQIETEGIMLKGDNVILNVAKHVDKKPLIYTIPKTEF